MVRTRLKQFYWLKRTGYIINILVLCMNARKVLPSTHVVNHVVYLQQPNLGIDRCGVWHQNRSASSLHWSSSRPNNKLQTSCSYWTAVTNVTSVCRGKPEGLSVSFKISSWVTVRVLFRAVEIEARHSTYTQLWWGGVRRGKGCENWFTSLPSPLQPLFLVPGLSIYQSVSL